MSNMGQGRKKQSELDAEVRRAAADRAFASKLAEGGQGIRLDGRADIYDVTMRHDKIVREHLGYTKVRPILSSKIQLPDQLRIVGNLYGSSVEILQTGLSGEFMPVVVDGGKTNTSGPQEYLVEVRRRVQIADQALKGLPDIRHRVSPRVLDGVSQVGSHGIIPQHIFVQALCVYGMGVTEIAFRAGWWSLRSGVKVLPKQQGQKLKAALRDALETVDEAWSAEGIEAQLIAGRISCG